MGSSDEQIIDRFRYARPEERLLDRAGSPTPAMAELDSVLGAWPPIALVVIDGITDAPGVEGIDVSDNSGVARWMRALPKRCADRTGAPVIGIDHVTKSKEGRGTWALGAQAKRAGLSGAAYSFNVIEPPRRALAGEAEIGKIDLRLVKDRPGFVRGLTADGSVGTMILTAYPNDDICVEILPPVPSGHGAEDRHAEAILDHVRAHPGASQREILDTVRGNRDEIRAELQKLKGSGRIRMEPKGNTHRHFVTEDEERGEGNEVTVPVS